jgi:hypothetical protein
MSPRAFAQAEFRQLTQILVARLAGDLGVPDLGAGAGADEQRQAADAAAAAHQLGQADASAAVELRLLGEAEGAARPAVMLGGIGAAALVAQPLPLEIRLDRLPLGRPVRRHARVAVVDAEDDAPARRAGGYAPADEVREADGPVGRDFAKRTSAKEIPRLHGRPPPVYAAPAKQRECRG